MGRGGYTTMKLRGLLSWGQGDTLKILGPEFPLSLSHLSNFNNTKTSILYLVEFCFAFNQEGTQVFISNWLVVGPSPQPNP
jgi:hypothetical protein